MSKSRTVAFSFVAGWGRWFAVYVIEVATVLCAGVFAFLLRFDFSIPQNYLLPLEIALAIWVVCKLAAFRMLGLDRRWARYIALPDLLRLSISNLAGSFSALIILLFMKAGVPRTVYAIDFLLCMTLAAGLRVGVRLAAELGRPNSWSPLNRKQTLVYGAGVAGATLLRDLRLNPILPYDVCGIVDDDPRKTGLVLHGVKVFGTGDGLDAIAVKTGADMVLIAAPSADGAQMKAIIERCTQASLPYKTIPGLAEIIDEHGLARQIRDVAVEDLLGRIPVNLEQERISAQIRGKVILVTGAAGSIGSEICRQIARFHPAAIVGFEIAESPLFHLQAEIARIFPGVTFHAEIGSIQNAARLREVFSRHQPAAVYHAAAYKHVPLMESHAIEAVENNVFGTLNVVEAAREHGTPEFVMISSDKAVRPANVMGATKRIAEMVVRSMQPEGARYVSVRFGNVLGSSGSVVPIFKEQIARGGPVTVTDPAMCRYFMTIPEACQLVLQASTMGNGGEIFVLDMGEPVRIVDLARNLILLSGLRPEQDIRIEFTGVRPGEKMFEEVSADGEGLLGTHHEKVRIFESRTDAPRFIEAGLERLKRCCRNRSADEFLDALQEMVPEYTPVQQHTRAKMVI